MPRLSALLLLAALSAAARAQEDADPPQEAAGSGSAALPDEPQLGNIAVSEAQIDGDVDDLVWAGPDRKIIFLLSDKKAVFRSADDGKTWVNVMSKLNALLDGDAQVGKDALNRVLSGVKSILLSPNDPSRLFFVGVGEVSWVTKDAGATFSLVGASASGGQLHEVKLHPTNPDLVIASSMSKRCHDSDAKGFCFKSLSASEDFGASWNRIATYVVQFDWAYNMPDESIRETVPEKAIFATLFDSKTGNQRFGYWDKTIHFYRSDSYFKDKSRLVRYGNRFLFTSRYLFVARVNPKAESEVFLAISRDGGRSFKRAVLPFKIKQHSYTILDTSEDSVFLHVNHKGDGSNWGNVYISNAVGRNYTLSLPHNRRDTNGKCDFEKMEGLEGIYVANFIDNVDYQDEDGVDADKYTPTQERRKRRGRSKKVAPAKPRVRTVITYDKGGVWGYLRPPRKDANNKPIKCSEDDCSLHLHGVTDIWGPFYSTESAIGLMMATGNVGSYLTEREDEINTFFSRDGGLTWFEVRKGSHIYEFGDHGALIVMANDQHATRHIVYSWNEGLSWNTFEFTQNPMEVENIIIEPTATSQRFLIYGSREDQSGRRSGVVVSLDFTEMHVRSCTGVDVAGTEESDYEKWSPSDGRLGDQCLLGHQVSYTRRKRDRACFNGEEYERAEFVKNCLCTEEDWECDEGYYRKMDGGPCVPTKRRSNSSVVAPETCAPGGYYEISTGYRKVAGDTCEGGVDHSPMLVPCPHWLPVASGGFSVLVLLAVFVVALGTITYLHKSGKSPADLLSCFGFGGASTRPAASYGQINQTQPSTASDFYSDDVDFGLASDDEGEAQMLGHADIGSALQTKSQVRAAPAPAPRAPAEPVPTLSKPRGANEDLLTMDDDDGGFDGDAI